MWLVQSPTEYLSGWDISNSVLQLATDTNTPNQLQVGSLKVRSEKEVKTALLMISTCPYRCRIGWVQGDCSTCVPAHCKCWLYASTASRTLPLFFSGGIRVPTFQVATLRLLLLFLIMAVGLHDLLWRSDPASHVQEETHPNTLPVFCLRQLLALPIMVSIFELATSIAQEFEGVGALPGLHLSLWCRENLVSSQRM